MDGQDQKPDASAVVAEAAGNIETQSSIIAAQPEAVPERDLETLISPGARLDTISMRIMAVELANGVGLTGREIAALGNIQLDEDTINRRRKAGPYQRVLTDLRKDSLTLISETQTKAIRKLREHIDHPDPKISQRAALFFADSTMTIHLKKAEYEMELELQRRQHKFEKKTIIQFEMNDSITVLGEPAESTPAAAPSTTAASSTIETTASSSTTPPAAPIVPAAESAAVPATALPESPSSASDAASIVVEKTEVPSQTGRESNPPQADAAQVPVAFETDDDDVIGGIRND